MAHLLSSARTPRRVVPDRRQSARLAHRRQGDAMAVEVRDVAYETDGLQMLGHLAIPDGDDVRPGVLVCHEGPGLDDHAKGRAQRLAAEVGVVAFALDYHGGGVPMARDEMMTRLGS